MCREHDVLAPVGVFRRHRGENPGVYWKPMFPPDAAPHATFLGLHVSNQLTAGDLVVGGGTLLLAVFAFLSVRVAGATVEAQDAPLLIGANVPADSPVAKNYAGQSWDPPFAGALAEGSPLAFAMRLWNVGRGPAVVRDVRLEIDGRDALRPLPSHVIVNAGGVHDGVWKEFAVAKDRRSADLTGTLQIIYAHPNGRLLVTVSRVEMRDRALYVRTIRRHKVRRLSRKTQPRTPV